MWEFGLIDGNGIFDVVDCDDWDFFGGCLGGEGCDVFMVYDVLVLVGDYGFVFVLLVLVDDVYGVCEECVCVVYDGVDVYVVLLVFDCYVEWVLVCVEVGYDCFYLLVVVVVDYVFCVVFGE